MSDNARDIGQSLSNFQSALNQQGTSLGEFINENYSKKWLSDEMYNVMAIRTTYVHSICDYLVKNGLLNLEKIMMSIITDPLAHDIEHTPTVMYKGHPYLTTHSMIYSKFLACSNKKVKGIYVDSSNIRLELESPTGEQRGKYLADFSQIDIELRRESGLTLDDYYNNQSKVLECLHADFDKMLGFFEGMLTYAMEQINERNKDDMKNLGIIMEVPNGPFPRFPRDAAVDKYGAKVFEEKCGEETKSQFFWVTGLMRENYDLIYPYLNADGSKIPLSEVKSESIFNYDIVAKSIDAKTGKHSPAKEILSGAIREWLYEPIIERIIDNKVLPSKPVIKDGNMENIGDLGGYGPFLYYSQMKDDAGNSIFPDTMGGGIGLERSLYALLRGEKIKKIDEVTYFGKNPDSFPLYLY